MSGAKICFITAIYGNYESSCKKFIPQQIPADFICFTDNPNIVSNGWNIDTTPYHILNKSPLDDDSYTNSLKNNKHTFNIAKYYKQAFQTIPILKKYEVVVWLDGTVEITHQQTSRFIMNNIYKHKIIGWNHEWRWGYLINEVKVSETDKRYNSTFWNNQEQPRQDVWAQYEDYIKDGYDERYFDKLFIKDYSKLHHGVWITCFVAFLNKDPEVTDFLNLWYLQTLKYTTQDQVGFPYVCQKLNLIPMTLPNSEITGRQPHVETLFYKKHSHGK
jgi:hypothetical protein